MAEMKYFFNCDKCGRMVIPGEEKYIIIRFEEYTDKEDGYDEMWEGVYCKECADKINSVVNLKGEAK